MLTIFQCYRYLIIKRLRIMLFIVTSNQDLICLVPKPTRLYTAQLFVKICKAAGVFVNHCIQSTPAFELSIGGMGICTNDCEGRNSTHKRDWSQIYEWQHTQGKRTVDTREPTDTTDVHKILQNQPKLTPSLASIVLNPFQWYVSISKTKQRSSYGKE